MMAYPRNIADAIIYKKVDEGIKGAENSTFKDKDILSMVEKAGFLPSDYLVALRCHYIKGEKLSVIASKINKSPQSVGKYIDSAVSEILKRSIPLFTYPEDYVCCRETSIWYMYKVPESVLSNLQRSGYQTLGDLKDSEGKYVDRIVVGKKYSEVIDKYLDVISFKEAKKNEAFAVLKWYDTSAYGFKVTKEGNFAMSEISKKNLEGYTVIDLADSIYDYAIGDVPLLSCNFIPGTSKRRMVENGISTLKDITSMTWDELMSVKGINYRSAKKIENELKYRKLGELRVVENLIEPKVVKSNSGVSEVTEEVFKCMEDMSNDVLPKEFRLSIMGSISVTTGDMELLSLYAEYLLENDREVEWFVFQEMVSQYGESCPVGLIHFMENHRDFVFKKNILSDQYSSACLGHYISTLSQGIDNKLMSAKYKNVVSTLLNRYGNVNIQDLANYFLKIEWNMPEENIIYLYKNYRNDSKVFVSKPKVEATNNWNDIQLIDYCKKAGISKEHDINIIKRRCKLLEVSYDYAFEGINKVVASGTKKPLEEIGMLVLWFNFNYDAMRVYLSENANFGKEV